MKNMLCALSLAALILTAVPAWAATPVFSANGFVCGKEGVTVTCKGGLPNGKDTITGTGHNLVYLTINTTSAGAPTRFTYFSDTGCLIGYTFGAGGQPVAAVAAHRSGIKSTFSFDDGKYEKIVQYCMQDNPGAAAQASSTAKPPAQPVSTAQKDAAAAKSATTPAKPAAPK